MFVCMRHNFLCFVLQLPASVMMCVRRMETAAQTDVQVRVIVIVMSCIINLYITGICYCTDDCESRLNKCCYYCSYSESIYQNNNAFYHACRGRASSDFSVHDFGDCVSNVHVHAGQCFCHYGCSTLGNCCDFCPSKHNTVYTDLRWSIH